MEHYPLRLTKEQKAKLTKRAKQAGRSMNAHIQYLIDHDGDIPVVGKIADGKVEFSEEYKEYLAGVLDPRD